MQGTLLPPPAAGAWTEEKWNELESRLRGRILRSRSDERAWSVIVAASRHVLRSFSTSFFIVTRFLPAREREQVEAIYAAVRYPDALYLSRA